MKGKINMAIFNFGLKPQEIISRIQRMDSDSMGMPYAAQVQRYQDYLDGKIESFPDGPYSEKDLKAIFKKPLSRSAVLDMCSIQVAREALRRTKLSFYDSASKKSPINAGQLQAMKSHISAVISNNNLYSVNENKKIVQDIVDLETYAKTIAEYKESELARLAELGLSIDDFTEEKIGNRLGPDSSNGLGSLLDEIINSPPSTVSHSSENDQMPPSTPLPSSSSSQPEIDSIWRARAERHNYEFEDLCRRDPELAELLGSNVTPPESKEEHFRASIAEQAKTSDSSANLADVRDAKNESLPTNDVSQDNHNGDERFDD